MKIKLNGPATAKCGDVYEIGGAPYILARVATESYSLISLQFGSRHRDPRSSIADVFDGIWADPRFLGRLEVSE